MKTLKSIESTIRPEKGRVEISSNSKNKHNSRGEIASSKVGGNKIRKSDVAKKKNY